MANQFGRVVGRVVALLAVVAVSVAAARTAASADLVVEALAGTNVALRPGDVLLAWSSEAAQGTLRHASDLRHLAIHQLSRRAVTLHAEREGTRVDVSVSASAWPLEIDVHPTLL